MSLAHALFSASQAKVLGHLFGTPQRWYHVNELMRLTALGSASLQRELGRLEEAGLLEVERLGNLKRVRANAASPVFQELCSLVRKTIGVIAVLADALAPYAARIRLALIYGSMARGTDRALSDIDLLVVSDELQTADLLAALLDAETRLGRRISPNVYRYADFARRREDPDSFIAKILGREVEILIGRLDESVAW